MQTRLTELNVEKGSSAKKYGQNKNIYQDEYKGDAKSRHESGQSDALLGYTRTNHAGATITYAPRGLLIGCCMKERVILYYEDRTLSRRQTH